jgi:hypothetical protein
VSGEPSEKELPMEYREMLHRYVGRRVCVSTFGHAKLWGRLAAVNDDCLRLVNTILSAEPDDAWLNQSQFSESESPIGNRHAETVIHFHHIVAISCLDDDLPELMAAGHEGASGFAGPVPKGDEALDRLFGDEALDYVRSDRLELHLGPSLAVLADPKRDDGLADRLINVRNSIVAELGIVLPPIRLRSDPRLPGDEYRIVVCGTEVARDVVRPQKLLAIKSGKSKAVVHGEQASEPAFRRPAVWVEPHCKAAAQSAGYLVAEPSDVLAMHLQLEVNRHAHELFSVDALRLMLEHLRYTSPAAVEELVPHRMPLARLHDLLGRLVQEGVPLRPLERILECIGHLPQRLEDPEEMLAALRVLLGRIICGRFRDPQGRLPLCIFSSDVAHRITVTFDELPDPTDGFWLAGILDGVRSWYAEYRATGAHCALAVDPSIRRRIQQLVWHQASGLPVLALTEIPASLPIDLVATLSEKELGMAERPSRARRSRRTKKAPVAGPVEANPLPLEPEKRRRPR